MARLSKSEASLSNKNFFIARAESKEPLQEKVGWKIDD
jgi:hypothetical protein